MSWRDRPYSDDDYGYGSGPPRPELRFQFRRPGMLVTWLVLINVGVYLVELISLRFSPFGFMELFGLSLAGISRLWVWQLVTYMFVHDPHDIFHILFNMLLLFFVGRQIEQGFGRERFLQFYGLCGIVGGMAYLALGTLSTLGAVSPRYFAMPLIGASGAVWGLLIAAMIFYPSMQIIFFVFPMPIRVFGAIMLGIVLFQALSPGGIQNLGGEVCHAAGAGAGVAILYFWGMMPSMRFGSGRGPSFMGRLRKGTWQRKQRRLADEQAEVDRILEKVHQQGIHSLTRRERKTLSSATQRQREREREAGRIDRV